jgi:hypothetical protein
MGEKSAQDFRQALEYFQSIAKHDAHFIFVPGNLLGDTFFDILPHLRIRIELRTVRR